MSPGARALRPLVDAATIFRREWLRYRRDRAYWLGQLAFPIVAVGFVGFGMNRVVALPDGTPYVAHLGAGVLALLVGSGGVGGGFTLIQDREQGFLRALLVAPVSRTSLVLGKMAARALASLALVALLAALLAAVASVAPPNPFAAAGAVVGITAVFVALGIALATSLRSLESFRVLSALVTVPLYFLSGIFYPIGTLPAPMRALAHANPLTYGVDLLRFGLLGSAEIPPARSAALLALLTVFALAAAAALVDRRLSR